MTFINYTLNLIKFAVTLLRYSSNKWNSTIGLPYCGTSAIILTSTFGHPYCGPPAITYCGPPAIILIDLSYSDRQTANYMLKPYYMATFGSSYCGTPAINITSTSGTTHCGTPAIILLIALSYSDRYTANYMLKPYYIATFGSPYCGTPAINITSTSGTTHCSTPAIHPNVVPQQNPTAKPTDEAD